MKLKLNLFITLAVIFIVLTLGAGTQVLARREGATPTQWVLPAIVSLTPTLSPTPGWWADLPTPWPMPGTATASPTHSGVGATRTPYPTLPVYATWTPAR